MTQEKWIRSKVHVAISTVWLREKILAVTLFCAERVFSLLANSFPTRVSFRRLYTTQCYVAVQLQERLIFGHSEIRII